jgi:hypothetical protein
LVVSSKNSEKKGFELYFSVFFGFGSFFFQLFHFQSLFNFLLRNFFITNFIFFIIFFLLFLRWSQVENRFNDSRLFYEEGSWYDGQIWEKPFFLIKNDRLLISQKIQPIIQRISQIILILFSITFLSFLFI